MGFALGADERTEAAAALGRLFVLFGMLACASSPAWIVFDLLSAVAAASMLMLARQLRAKRTAFYAIESHSRALSTTP